MKISYECKCPSCGCKCGFVYMWCKCLPLECLMQKSLLGFADMNAAIWWCKMKTSWFEIQMSSRKMHMQIFSYACNASVWDINQLYLSFSKQSFSKPLTSIPDNLNHHSSFHSWCGLKTHCSILVQKMDYLV